MLQEVEITQASETQQQELVEYVMRCRKILFPAIDHSVLPKDLKDFQSYYLSSNPGAFLQARDRNHKLVGVIAMMPYDHRFPYLGKLGNKPVEVARLFVEPEWRKLGVGSLLFNELEKIAQQRTIDLLYLHTHLFLEGAFTFWEKQGFRFLESRIESGVETLHMSKVLEINAL